MCFGIPMQVRSVDGFLARCEAKGVEREVNLFMLQHETIEVGDYVVVHLGQAVEKVSAERAMEAWEIYDAMLASAESGAG
ncbi:HypC/HybG/HupF family hydrogenase formation chaperone [Imhoffiella purpurea]|uniref:[NiFe] hydrogenase metallocenter assembly protein HypC n=1 Tax=Imhoffiella purpurea TaxID=1249627 RepID=W9VFD7_9GAMM|nr:HypC/HybG/HupF family hydrogenase formation chaperone [Imhoffiella purpurea]EXJ15721.1 [NiFe] hydrogenase metallocenter assembly protein HypC [Imhoffiella purpurea]